MVRESECEVLVVGAGPVGMTVAAFLAHRGIHVEIVEEGYRPAARSYALAIHPGTLAILAELGLARALVARGRLVDTLAFYEEDARRTHLSVADLRTDFPFVLVLPQSALEEVLAKYLAAQAVRIHWSSRALGLDLSRQGVVGSQIARLAQESASYGLFRNHSPVEKPQTTCSYFVVGADGYHSAVRRALGLELETVGPSQTFGVFEVDADWSPEQEMRVVLREDTTSVLWPLGHSRCRWSFELADPKWKAPRLKRRLLMQMGEEAFPYVAVDLLEDLLRERAPWFDAKVREVTWSVAVTFERRLVPSFGRDGVWLLGDAAHLACPVGAHSMNVGLREAADLAARLAAILRDGASRDLLADYDRERRAEWRTLLALDGGPRPGRKAGAWARANAERILAAIPASGDELAQLLAQIDLEMGPERETAAAPA